MRYLFGFICALALGLMGCSETTGTGGSAGSGGVGGDGGNGGGTWACAELAGDWANATVSCDDVVQDVPRIEYNFGEDCTGHAAVAYGQTCFGDTWLTFTRENGESTIVDTGAKTCDLQCAEDECQEAADGGLPYSATLIVTDDTWTLTAVTTEQMVSDEITPCEAGQTMVSVAVRIITDCTGLDDGTACGFGGQEGECFKESCHAFDCTDRGNGVKCFVEGPTDDSGLCLDGVCVAPVEDCTDQEDWTPCGTDGDGFICFGEQCAALGCSGLQDGTTCVSSYMFGMWLNACEAGECVYPEDCTGIADGVLCLQGEDVGVCDAGECVNQ